MLEYQRLTAFANSLPSHIKAQFGHTKSVRVAIPDFVKFEPYLAPQPGQIRAPMVTNGFARLGVVSFGLQQ